MSETEARRHLLAMLESFTAGSVLHILAQVIQEAEQTWLGGLDETAEQRVQEAQAFLWVAGYGLMSALPRG